jgi:hypothetical protein
MSKNVVFVFLSLAYFALHEISDSICFPINNIISSYLLAECYSIVYMYHIFFVHSLTVGPLGWLHCLSPQIFMAGHHAFYGSHLCPRHSSIWCERVAFLCNVADCPDQKFFLKRAKEHGGSHWLCRLLLQSMCHAWSLTPGMHTPLACQPCFTQLQAAASWQHPPIPFVSVVLWPDQEDLKCALSAGA